MKIIYRQDKTVEPFDSMGLEGLMVKHIFCEADKGFVSLKEHHHTNYEIHIIKKGCQTYKAFGETFEVNEGNGIIFAPKTKHTAVSYVPDTEKISLVFSMQPETSFGDFVFGKKDARTFLTGSRLMSVLDAMVFEKKNSFAYSDRLIASLAFEALVLVERYFCTKKITRASVAEGGDIRIMMAKDYISDNIDLDLKVRDVASYCYMGQRQLTRLFNEHESIAPAMYIRQKKVERIEKLLMENMSLSQISEKMNFASEYHFNSFFKKYAGMPPGEYRKMNNLK